MTSLEDSLTKFARKAVEYYHRHYLETVICTAYFKVPEFREKVLDACSTQDEFEELSAIGYACINLMSPGSRETDSPGAISNVMDWTSFFQGELPFDKETANILNRVLMNRGWQDKI